MNKLIIGITISLLLSACTPFGVKPTNSEQLNNWKIQGKLGVTTPHENVSGFLVWEQHHDKFRIHVSGPFGRGSTEIKGDLKKITLTQGGKRLTSDNPQQLIYEQLGWYFPIENLKYWVTGSAAPNTPALEQRNENETLSDLKQDNWHIEYIRYDRYSGMPSRVKISQGDWRFLLVIKHWSIG